MARELFILFFCATIAFLLGKGYYWIGIAIGTFVFLVMVSGAAVMAFLVCVALFGSSK